MIIIILAMLFSVPLFDVNSYINPPTNYGYGIQLIETFFNSTNSSALISYNNTFWIYVNEEKLSTTPLV